jgi:hypothetical protein
LEAEKMSQGGQGAAGGMSNMMQPPRQNMGATWQPLNPMGFAPGEQSGGMGGGLPGHGSFPQNPQLPPQRFIPKDPFGVPGPASGIGMPPRQNLPPPQQPDPPGQGGFTGPLPTDINGRPIETVGGWGGQFFQPQNPGRPSMPRIPRVPGAY